LALLAEESDESHAVLGDLGYEGEQDTLTLPVKRTADRPLTADQRTVNALHAATRAPAERGNCLLKTTFKALRRVSLCPGGSARSPPPPWSCSTTSTAAPHDQQAGRAVTGNGSLMLAFPDQARTQGVGKVRYVRLYLR
jgi:DDE superfamily endonuclease